MKVNKTLTETGQSFYQQNGVVTQYELFCEERWSVRAKWTALKNKKPLMVLEIGIQHRATHSLFKHKVMKKRLPYIPKGAMKKLGQGKGCRFFP